MTPLDAAAAYEEARERAVALLAAHAPHIVAQLRAGLAAEIHAEDTRPPTVRQRQLVWALGYRGPAPRTRAEVARLVDRLDRRSPRR